MNTISPNSISPSIILLIVDDEKDVLQATKSYLTITFPVEVDTAESGQIALQMIAQKKYDAIISDYEMDEMSGIELLKNIRSQGLDTPFIIFTGKGREEVVIAAFENGADGYVMKGGEIRSQFVDLYHKIKTIVQKREAEKTIKEVECKFHDIYNNSPIAIELFDEQGTIIEINPAGLQLFGIDSIESVKGYNLFSDTSATKEKLEELRSGKVIKYVTEFDFDLQKQQNQYASTKSGKITLFIQITPLFKGTCLLSGYIAHTIDITEEKTAQEDLKEQKLFLDYLLETIPSPVFYKDAEGRYTGCNSAFEKYIGLSKDDLIGKSVFDISPRDLAEVYHAKDKELFTKPGMQVYESQVRFADGTNHDVIFQKATLVDRSGKVQGLIGIILDITERKGIEHALQESEDYIRTVLDNLPIGVAVNTVEPEVSFEYFNDNFLKLYRVSADALNTPDAFWDHVYEDPIMRESLKKRVLEDCMSGDTSRMHWDDIPITRTGEVTTYVNAMNIPIHEKNLMISVVWDITDRKRAEDSLRETNRLLEGMLDGIPDIIGIQNPDHTLIRYNRAGYEILGLTPEEVRGKPCYSFIGRTKPCDICASMKALSSKKICTLEKYVPELNRYLLCRSNPILDDNGNVQLIIEQLSDITERKQMEDAIRQSNQKLRLLTGLTRHDILNLLNAIYFYHELALESPDLKASREYITRAKEAGERIEATIGFTREYEEFGVASSGWQLIHPIIESAKQEISPGTIQINNTVPESIEVYADPIIRKVFTTLLENAIRHGKKVTQITFGVDEKQKELVIFCEDDGVGIPDAEKTQIFGHGFGKNTGIGLFLSREILSITGLSISETGIFGKGARFEIRVPGEKWRSKKI